MCALQAAKLIVRPQRPHQAHSRVIGGSQEQVTNLVSDCTAEEGRPRRRRSTRDRAHGEEVDRHQHPQALIAIEHRLTEHDDAIARRWYPIDESQHQVAAGDQWLSA